jgi:proteasome lid subunit RPN8/RPN11
VRELHLPDPLRRAMESHARESYPEECCGFLFVRADEREGGPRHVVAVERARNQSDGERARRFEIPPEHLREVERRLDGSGQMVGGFYHSHPDHPARPSEFDRDHAWPWYSYLVLGVTAREEGPLGAFELDPESGEFLPAPVVTEGASDWSGGKRTPKSLSREKGTP